MLLQGEDSTGEGDAAEGELESILFDATAASLVSSPGGCDIKNCRAMNGN